MNLQSSKFIKQLFLVHNFYKASKYIITLEIYLFFKFTSYINLKYLENI